MPIFTTARSALLGLTAAALLTGASVVPVPTAFADIDHCYVQLDAPTKIAIKGPHRDVDVRLYDECGFATYVSIDLYGPRGWEDIFIFDRDPRDRWDLYNWQEPGTCNTRLSSAYNWLSEDIAWLLDFVDTDITVKYGSKSSITTKRSGKNVTLRMTSTSYSPTAVKYRAWNASSAEIQFLTDDGWEHLKTVKLKNGKASYTYRTSTKQLYRFVTNDDATHFGARSATSRR